MQEVQSWETGLFRGGFKSADDLRQGITRALYDHALANATGPVDQAEMAQRAAALLPEDRRGYSGTASLNLAVAGGPRQSILRPVELEKRALTDALIQRAFFGDHRLFDLALGRDYPREGLNDFSMFGVIPGFNIPLNVMVFSRQKVPPYEGPTILGRITGFSIGKNMAGQRIIIPHLWMVALGSEVPPEVIINVP